ncbi:MAG: RDD family protein [Methanoregula sp. PtaU1.Bin051]|nr:MAG: RDD family protein [Methanoregula sp. PtaU1.Bin051]
MFCPKCGKETDASGKYCQWCGADIEVQTPPKAVVKVDEEESAPSTGDYAGLGRRFFAFVIDAILLLILITIAATFFNLVAGVKYFYYIVVQHAPVSELTVAGTSEAAYTPIIAALGVLFIIIPWLYFAGFECSRGMATPGKTVMHIVVTDKEGNRISFSRATIRHFVKYISAAIILIGFIMIGLTRKRQGLHDMAAGCLVLLPE